MSYIVEVNNTHEVRNSSHRKIACLTYDKTRDSYFLVERDSEFDLGVTDLEIAKERALKAMSILREDR